MSAKIGNLGGKKEAAALLLALGRSVRASARDSGVSERTLANWKTDDTFQARVLELQAELFGRAVGTLCGISIKAATTLAKLLKSDDEKIQLGAARIVLEAAPRLREQAKLTDEIEELRRLFEEVHRRGDGNTVEASAGDDDDAPGETGPTPPVAGPP